MMDRVFWMDVMTKSHDIYKERRKLSLLKRIIGFMLEDGRRPARTEFARVLRLQNEVDSDSELVKIPRDYLLLIADYLDPKSANRGKSEVTIAQYKKDMNAIEIYHNLRFRFEQTSRWGARNKALDEAAERSSRSRKFIEKFEKSFPPPTDDEGNRIYLSLGHFR